MERRHKPYETKKNSGGLSESRVFAAKAKRLRTWCGYCSRASCVASYSFRFAERVGEGRLPFLDDIREVHLTDKGQTVARETYERHQTFQSLLEDLGVDGKTAAEDACQMEHAVSQKSYEALRKWTNRKKASGCE